LRELLEQVIPRDSQFTDFLVEVELPGVGKRSVALNARRLPTAGQRPAFILLALEDETVWRTASAALAESEARYRRLFETAQDGILLVDPRTGRIFDANPFLTALLGFSHAELVGKELWQIGLFHDIESNRTAFRTLQENGYIRYDDLPLRTHDGRGIEVEFVSNVYSVVGTLVIQCNIRDVTDRKKAEDALRVLYAELEERVHERTAELARANHLLQQEIARRERAEAERRVLQQGLTTAQEDERRRIARELHDQLGQHLTALALGLKLAEHTTTSAGRERLTVLQTLTDQIGREMHDLALELRPTALDDLGLAAALAHYTERWAERTGVEVDFHSSGLDEDRLSPPLETTVYRVVQEALANVRRHAAAARVSVVVRRLHGVLSAIVEDDGRGFQTEAVGSTRLGLLGMRERVVMFGGTLVIDSTPDRGTTVIARFPLTDEPTRPL
jgi:PAS domain S-box-containing protein